MKRFFINIKKYYKYALRSAKAELKSEVVDSYLNWLWWIIEPLCFMLIYWFIFKIVFNNNMPYFASFVFIGQTAWDFFNRMISGSVKLIINNRDLVTKVYIPKYILLLSKSFTYLFKMGISLLITFIIMLIQGVPFTISFLWLIPLFIILYLVSFGFGMILMHYGVTLNDLSNLTNIALRMLFYLSGIFYDVRAKLTGNLQFAMLKANPVACIMDGLRRATLYGIRPGYKIMGFWLLMGIILCSIGVHVIHKNENSYAKVI